jgi:hypothetical protein
MNADNNLHPTDVVSKKKTFKLPVPKRKIIKFPLWKWTSKEEKEFLYKIELLKFIKEIKELGEKL